MLTALWLDMLAEFETTATRDLFVDWLMITQPVKAAYCRNNPVDQQAGPSTLVEVLQVAAQGQAAAICQVFDDRDIEPPDPNLCPESAGWFCHADCDGNVTLDFWDFLCFQNAYVTGASYADCDGDDQFTFFDFLCFQNAFVGGCP